MDSFYCYVFKVTKILFSIVYSSVNATQCIFDLRNCNFHLLNFDLLNLTSSCLKIWNTDIINLLMFSKLNLPSVSFQSPFSLIAFFPHHCIFLFLCTFGSFTWMSDIVFYILLGAGYFCIPINIFEALFWDIIIWKLFDLLGLTFKHCYMETEHLI